MRKLALLLLALASLPAIALAGECTDRPECWPEGSAMRTGLLLAERQAPLEKLLANKHRELVELVAAAATPDGQSIVDARLVKALEAQQPAWLAYRAHECELVGLLTGSGGNWPSTYANRCELNLTDQRLRRVRSSISCVKKKAAAGRLFEQHDCLQQLAPLANK